MFNKLFSKKQKATVFNFNILGLDNSVHFDNIVAVEIKKKIQEFHEIENEIRNKDTSCMLEGNKRIVIDMILKKLKEMKEYGESKRMYKDDYQNLKQMLLTLLFGLFGTAEDIGNLDYTISALKEMAIIPENSTKEEIIQNCPVGRWY